jgi:DHA1 family inner membrane transport protein
VRLRHEVSALGNPQVLLALLMTLLGFGGVFAALTYLTPIMTEVTGFGESAMTPILIVLGLGMFIGNWFGGKMADKALMPTVVGSLAALVVALFPFTFTSHQPVLAVINVFLLGALGMATVPPLQTLVLQRASAAPTLASAINIGAFNLGNAVAAWLAGFTIAAGLGLESAGWVGALMTLTALILAFVSVALMRREARNASTASASAATTNTNAKPQLADASRA